MLGSFFNTTEVDAFADWVVSEVKRALPATQTSGIKNIADRAEKLNQSIAKRTGEFKKTAKLNIYKKAHLAARVREGMSAHGYPPPFVKAFSIDLLSRLQAASAKR